MDSGYVLFDLPEGGKAWKGSLELVRTTDPEGRDATRVVVTLPDLPRHFEGVLLDKLAIKLRTNTAAPRRPAPAQAATPRRRRGRRASPAPTRRAARASRRASCPAPSER